RVRSVESSMIRVCHLATQIAISAGWAHSRVTWPQQRGRRSQEADMTDETNPVRDVVVIGGGAAGLGAGMTLARARRRVTIVDAGEPRNAPADGVHGLLGLDGMNPLELLARGRGE